MYTISVRRKKRGETHRASPSFYRYFVNLSTFFSSKSMSSLAKMCIRDSPEAGHLWILIKYRNLCPFKAVHPLLEIGLYHRKRRRPEIQQKTVEFTDIKTLSLIHIWAGCGSRYRTPCSHRHWKEAQPWRRSFYVSEYSFLNSGLLKRVFL